MTVAGFLLVKKTPITIYRSAAGSYVDGEWVEGVEAEVLVEANVQPLSDYQYMILPESDRTKQWVWVFSSSELRTLKEGIGGYAADEFVWNNERYKVMKTQRFQMTVQDHWEAKAARIPLTPD
jgi:hypothetical protein